MVLLDTGTPGFECKNLYVVLIRGKLDTRSLDGKQELAGKFSKWTVPLRSLMRTVVIVFLNK